MKHDASCRVCQACGVHDCYHIYQSLDRRKCWVDVRGEPTCTAANQPPDLLDQLVERPVPRIVVWVEVD